MPRVEISYRADVALNTYSSLGGVMAKWWCSVPWAWKVSGSDISINGNGIRNGNYFLTEIEE